MTTFFSVASASDFARSSYDPPPKAVAASAKESSITLIQTFPATGRFPRGIAPYHGDVRAFQPEDLSGCHTELKSQGGPMPAFREGLSFDDVLLIPKQTTILPSEVDTSTEFLPGITLQTPIVSAPMDTVTDARLAIAMAREGGVGVLHRNMSIDAQAAEVDRVKRSESGVITKPFHLGPENTIQDAVALMERYHISGVPIVDAGEKLVGILTNRDIRFVTDYSIAIKERMTSKQLVTTTVGTTLEQAETTLAEHRIEKLPIVDAEGRLKGLITIKDILKVRQYPHATKDR